MFLIIKDKLEIPVTKCMKNALLNIFSLIKMYVHLVLRLRMCGAIPPLPICLHGVMLS
jgi:hypothetical protein